MIESYCRSAYHAFLTRPVAHCLNHFFKITPIQITFCALILGLLSAIFLVFDLKILAIGFLLLSGYCDTLDGALARLTGSASALGAMFDVVSDRIVEFAMMFALFLVAPQENAFAVIWMLGSSFICITTFLGVGIFTENNSDKSFHYSVGVMERFETFLFFIAMIVFTQWFIWLAWVYVVLVLITALMRLTQFKRMFDAGY